jgi:hypothetical protein
MSQKWVGGFITRNAPTTSRGIFTLTQQMLYKKLGIWS